MEEIEIIENTCNAQDEYGHRCGSDWWKITREQIQALLDGKQLAFADDEYSSFISMEEPKYEFTFEYQPPVL